MLLFVNQSENILTSQKAGLIAAVRNTNDTFIAQVMGFTVPVGFWVTGSVRRVSIKRLGTPYGKCIEEPDPKIYFYNSSYAVEVIKHSWTNVKSFIALIFIKGCLRSKIQTNIIEKCGCGDPRIPLPAGSGVSTCKPNDSNIQFAAFCIAVCSKPILNGDFKSLTFRRLFEQCLQQQQLGCK